MKREALKAQLRQHEGSNEKDGRHIPYKDTVGKWTIGYGRNISDRGISEAEAEALLDADVLNSWHACQVIFPGFDGLSDARQHALIDMCFNLGERRLRTFVKMRAAVDARDFERAAAEMLDSKWATQVGERARTLARQMRTGA